MKVRSSTINSFLASSSSTIRPEPDGVNPVFLTFMSLAEPCVLS